MRFFRMMLLTAAFAVVGGIAYAQTATSAPTASVQQQIEQNTQQMNQLDTQIAQYQTEIQATKQQSQTLQSNINQLNLSIKKTNTSITLTNKQINTTQLQIQQLATGIQSDSSTIADEEQGLSQALLLLNETDQEPLAIALLSDDGLTGAWQDLSDVQTIESAIGTDITNVASDKTSLAQNKSAQVAKGQQLAQQQQNLTTQKGSLASTENQKKQLLTETNSNEATYEQLLAQAQAQLQSFSTFAQNATSQGILTNQTSCDSWGCYYNQRDSEWGDDALDGTQFTMKSDGCLVTSLAMVMTHYGYSSVTPLTINSNPADFAVYDPAYLLINDVPVDGETVTRVSVGTSEAKMDAALATGNPLIVGIHAYGGTHYIVFVSGSKGNYIMRDPYQPNAKDVPFTQYYSLSEIFSSAKVVIS